MSIPELVTLALADAAHATRCGRCPRHHIARAVALCLAAGDVTRAARLARDL